MQKVRFVPASLRVSLSQVIRVGAAVCALLSLLGIFYRHFRITWLSAIGLPIVSTEQIPLQPWWLLTLMLWALWVGVQFFRKRQFGEMFFLPATALVIALLVIVVSDISGRRFSFYPAEDAGLFILVLGVFVAGLHWLRWNYERVDDGALRFFSLPALLFFQLLIVLVFLDAADGRILFSDDHPSFWYRLYLLQQQFPKIPFYSTFWESGYSAREFFASGLLNVYLLSLPLWLSGVDLLSLEQAVVYNYLILYVYVGLLPWSVYLAVRLFGYEKSAATIAAMLALGPTLGQFEWLLKYGTLGFNCSVGFFPLCLALIYRFAFSDEPPRVWQLVSLLFVSFLCVSWSLSIFGLVPAVVVALCYAGHTLARERIAYVLVFVGLFLVVNLPWMLVFVEESKVLSFVDKTTLPGAAQPVVVEHTGLSLESFQESTTSLLLHARQLIAKVNPLILVLLAPGLALLRNRRRQVLFGSTIGFLLVLAFFGEVLKPQLELRRMIIPAAYLACIPVALAIIWLVRELSSWLLHSHRVLGLHEKIFASSGLVIVAGMVVFSAVSVTAVYQNRSDEQFKFAPEYLGEFVESIATHGGDGRTFFLGFILHEFGATDYRSQDGGHIAILAPLTGKPMYAHYYYHSHWQTIDPIPKSFRDRRAEGIEEFLDLVNATAVVTSKREWANYCLANPRYQQVAQFDRFRIFTRRGPKEGYLISGQAEIREQLDGLVVRPLTEEVRLKYRYLPKLRSDKREGVKLFAFPAFAEDTALVKDNATGKPVLVTRQVEYLGLRVTPELVGKEIALGYWVTP